MSQIESKIEGPITKWTTLVLKTRVDSFNQHELVVELKNLLDGGSRAVAIDLRLNRFLSVNAIRSISAAARQVAARGGVFALLGCSERTKRHFESFGSLDHITVARTERDLPEPTTETAEVPVRENSPEAS